VISKVSIFQIAITSTIPFLPAISEDFVFDDLPAIAKNNDLVAASPAPIFWHDFWGSNLSSSTSHKSYRPLTTFSFWIQTRGHKMPPALNLKMVNVFLHFCCSLIFFLLLQSRNPLGRLPGKNQKELALFSALIFASHPVHVEPVASVVGRADLLCSLLILVACLFVACSPSPSLLLLPIFSLTALLAKEQGIVLPLFWVLLDLLKHRPQRQQWRKLLWRISSAICTVAILSLLRMWLVGFSSPSFQQGDNPGAALPTSLSRVATLQHYWALHALLLIWPQWLCFDWALGCVPVLDSNKPDLRFLSPLLLGCVLLLIITQAIREARNARLVLTWALAFLILPFLLSTNLLVTVGFVVAERALYLSVAGSAIVVVWGWQKIKSKCQQRLVCHLLNCALPSLIIIFSLRSAVRSMDWRKEVSLFTSGLSVCPSNAKVWYNIAKKRLDMDEAEVALTCYREAVRLAPSYEQALNNLGNLEKAQGRSEHAIRMLSRATKVNPKFAAAHMNLGIVLQSVGQTREAEAEYLMALSLRSPYADCEYNLGNLYLKTGQMLEAEQRLRNAASLGRTLAWGNLVLLLEEMGRDEEAHDAALKAVDTFPDNADMHFQLANSHGKRGEFAEGERVYKSAIKIAAMPKAVYYSNLGVLYHRWGKMDKAILSYKSALRINPNLRSAQENLGKLS